MINKENIITVGYKHYYLKNGELKSKFVPVEAKDAFLEKFGDDLPNANEEEVEKFLEKYREK